MKVLVDSSVWVAYFRGTTDGASVDWLIDEGLLVTNDLIVAELAPSLLFRKERKLAGLLYEIERAPFAPDWNEIVQMQLTCLRNGINHVGIPDLLIAQNAIQNNLALSTTDKHFTLMSEHIPLNLY